MAAAVVDELLMTRLLGLMLVVGCGSAPPTKINTPADYQNVVGDLVAQVIDIFKTDGVNCDMLSGDLHAMKDSQKLRAVQDWTKEHADAAAQAQGKIAERKADFDTAAAPAMRACGGVDEILQELVRPRK
jgi:hypothetical protein